MRPIVAILALLTALPFLHAAEWPCWRGPDGLGVSPEKNLPTEWSKEKNIAWSLELPGKGASSPIIVGDRLYVTTQTKETAMRVLAIDRKRGAIAWEREVAQGKQKANDLHNMATPTAASDGRFVWARFGTGDLACLDAADGKTVWHRNLGKEFGNYNANHGMGTSPMLMDGRLFVAVMHQGQSFVMALDAKTGKDVWKKDRNLGPTDEAQDSYSSPIFIHAGRGKQVVIAGAEAINAYEPATGSVLWSHGGLKVPHAFGRTIAGPTASGETVIVVASGFQNRGYTVALAAGKGEVKDRLWTLDKYSADCPTPLVYEGKVYCIRDDGNASCLDLKSGEVHWQQRLFSENVKVSPVAGDGKVYFMSGRGNCHVVRASPNFELLAKNELGEATLATPAISDGQLFIRTDARLLCVKR
jgi:outer membrane protein assembly factor BamB